MTTTQQAQKDTPPFRLIRFPERSDARGTLCVADPTNFPLPFEIRRTFWIYGVPAGQRRGSHAHHTCAEIVIAANGSFKAHVTDGYQTADFVMSSPSIGLYIPPMVWCDFSDFTVDCVCLCLTSHPYEQDGYINSVEEFLKEVKR